MAAKKVLKVYNGDEVDIVFGPVIIEGKGDDEFCRIEQEADDSEDEAGVDGEVAVSRTNDERTDITLTLMATADANAELSAIRTLFKTAPSSAGGILTLTIRNKNGLDLYVGANTWIKKPPPRTFKRTAGTNEWVLRAAHLDRIN